MLLRRRSEGAPLRPISAHSPVANNLRMPSAVNVLTALSPIGYADRVTVIGVPKEGLEPSRPFGRRILNPLRLPFRHFGSFVPSPEPGSV
jgi:hypothetical protein